MEPGLPIDVSPDPENPEILSIDAGSIRFTEPFFQQTVTRLLSEGKCPPVHRAPLRPPANLIRPQGLIFHIGRCGSTIISTSLAKCPDTCVISEAPPINKTLLASPFTLRETDRLDLLRTVVHYAAQSTGLPNPAVIVKFTSWNILYARALLRAWPGVPCVFVHRDPLEVMASLLKSPPGWAANPGATGQSPEDYFARALGSFYEASLTLPETCLWIDYPTLPDVLWTQILPHFGITPTEDTVATLRAHCAFHPKSSAKQVFVPDSDAKKSSASDNAKAAVELHARGHYQRMLASR